MSLSVDLALQARDFLVGSVGRAFCATNRGIPTLQFFTALAGGASHHRHVFGFGAAAYRLACQNVDLSIRLMHSLCALSLCEIRFCCAQLVGRVTFRSRVASKIDSLARAE